MTRDAFAAKGDIDHFQIYTLTRLKHEQRVCSGSSTSGQVPWNCVSLRVSFLYQRAMTQRILALLCAFSIPLHAAGHRLLAGDDSTQRLAIVKADGSIAWETK